MDRSDRVPRRAPAHPAAAIAHLAPRAALLALALATAGCASNPATGKSQLNFYSEAEEIAMGRQADEEIPEAKAKKASENGAAAEKETATA